MNVNVGWNYILNYLLLAFMLNSCKHSNKIQYMQVKKDTYADRQMMVY